MVALSGPRVVLVTGASSGIGRESALAFARRGDTVVGVARHAPALEELAAEHPGIHVETCDVTDAAERADLVKRVLAAHDRIDVLVNNAGVGALGYLDEMTVDDIERVYGTNVVAVADLTRLVLPGMRARRDGAVVMLSSVAAWASVPPATVYSSSKFAVHGLIEGLRRELRGSGVRVHSVNPAPIATDYLARAVDRSPQPGDPDRPKAPGFPRRGSRPRCWTPRTPAGRRRARCLASAGWCDSREWRRSVRCSTWCSAASVGRSPSGSRALEREQAQGVPAR